MQLHNAPVLFDTDRLLSPVSIDAPAGEFLRYEGTYDVIAGLRKEDDPQIAQGVWKSSLKRADWQRVGQICMEVLETRSKDLQIAAWLLEAWIHIHGFAGLGQGLRLVSDLCDTYWDCIHPDIRDGDLEHRLAPFVWIDEKLSVAVKLIPLTAPQTDEVPAYSFADWEIACRQPRQRDDAVPGPRQFQQSVALTPTPSLMLAARDVEGAASSVEELHNGLDARCGRHAPALAKLREAIGGAHAVLTSALNDRDDAFDLVAAPADARAEPVGDEPVEVFAGPPAVVGASGDVTVVSRPVGPTAIRTRAEAYQRLSEVADFLARTEPHSPVPHLIRRAVSWGNLSLEELLPELVRDSNQLSEIYRMLHLGGKA